MCLIYKVAMNIYQVTYNELTRELNLHRFLEFLIRHFHSPFDTSCQLMITIYFSASFLHGARTTFKATNTSGINKFLPTNVMRFS